MKILIYQPRVSYYTGGGEVYPLQTAKFFNKLGHDVTILTTQAKYLPVCEYFKKFMKENPGVKIEYLTLDDNYKDIYKDPPGVNWERWDKESLWVSRLGYEFLLKHKYDIVSVHCVIDSLAVPFNQKRIVHLHGAPDELNYTCKLILSKEKSLVAVSKNVADKWIKLGAFEGMKISTNAVDNELYIPNDNIEKNIDLIFVGRLIPIKGLQYTLKALKLLKEKYNLTPNFTIIGDGPYRQYLESLTNELGLKDQIVFKGLVIQENLIRSYQSAKIAAFPSYAKEGIMSTLLEAGSCGVPNITTRGSSMEEFAKDNENALLVEPENEEDLCEKIHMLLTDKELRSKISTNALKTIKEQYSWINKAKELIKIYSEV